jgi:hypothetical protein
MIVTAALVWFISACGGGSSGGGGGGSSLNVLPSVPVPMLTAMLMTPSIPNPTPVSTATPTPAPTDPHYDLYRHQRRPTSVPTSTPVPSPSGLWSNGTQIRASFINTVFGASGPDYQQLPASPSIDPNSANVINYYYAGFNGSLEYDAAFIDANSSQAQYDYSFPVYTALVSDPLVTLSWIPGGSVFLDNGAQIHVPSMATQAGGTDHHLSVIQPNGTEYDFWLVTSNPPYTTGSKLTAYGETHFNLNGTATGLPNGAYVAPGFNTAAATAGGIALTIGQIYTSELAAGVINHAINLIYPCSSNSWVYPSTQVTGVCGSGKGMPLGSRVWWVPTDTQTNAMSYSHDMKTLLIAMHHYGGFFTDNGGSGSSGSINGQGGAAGTHFENQEPYWIYGHGVDPAANYAASAPGWSHLTGGVDRYLLWGNVDFIHNLKLLNPCVTNKTC